ncbi:uncharacterized protein LOC116660763 isoform X1 [Camelus ferus]|uniref:Uncharacterized protein LOC116660763 isoform X1 n=1 Tax=Camelus ferus TaxID=419612 RepID=A0A8B8S979_CAMFR|nr:uncharacterized protein LOC116660763 isoform X1 [Camelus ferus]
MKLGEHTPNFRAMGLHSSSRKASPREKPHRHPTLGWHHPFGETWRDRRMPGAQPCHKGLELATPAEERLSFSPYQTCQGWGCLGAEGAVRCVETPALCRELLGIIQSRQVTNSHRMAELEWFPEGSGASLWAPRPPWLPCSPSCTLRRSGGARGSTFMSGVTKSPFLTRGCGTGPAPEHRRAACRPFEKEINSCGTKNNIYLAGGFTGTP